MEKKKGGKERTGVVGRRGRVRKGEEKRVGGKDKTGVVGRVAGKGRRR